MNETPEAPDSRQARGAARRQLAPARFLRARVFLLLRGLRATQDRLAAVLGSSADGRSGLVARMLERHANEVTSYWLQLAVSIGIATLGLVVGSAAVIIGAMLVAPLMGPIIALAMGLATGSPFLVLRSASRVVMSVLAAVGGAALMTLLLPYHEINAEIAARTSPTALDLLTAGFCALAGVYASLRPGSDTAATAAGTSIGISLVPPLCACGFGLGTSTWPVAGGAALLFLTNLVAIIFVGSLSFVAAGFNRVDSASLERNELSKDQGGVVSAAVAGRLAGLFESRAGPALRFLMPLLLLAAVYVPLRRALDEVAWQVRVRAAVNASLQRERHQIVQSRVRVERHEVELFVVLLGKTDDAEATRARLDAAIGEASGVVPRVDVLAIPDATAFAGLESSVRRGSDALAISPRPPLAPPIEQLEGGRAFVRSSVERLWPAAAVGEPLVIEVGTEAAGPLRVRVVHLGSALSPDAVESLVKSLRATLDRELQLFDVAISSRPVTRADGDLRFVAELSAGVLASAGIASVNVCVVEPRGSSDRRRQSPRERELAGFIRSILATHPRVTFAPGESWAVRFTRVPCSESAETAVDPSQAVDP